MVDVSFASTNWYDQMILFIIYMLGLTHEADIIYVCVYEKGTYIISVSCNRKSLTCMFHTQFDHFYTYFALMNSMDDLLRLSCGESVNSQEHVYLARFENLPISSIMLLILYAYMRYFVLIRIIHKHSVSLIGFYAWNSTFYPIGYSGTY